MAAPSCLKVSQTIHRGKVRIREPLRGASSEECSVNSGGKVSAICFIIRNGKGSSCSRCTDCPPHFQRHGGDLWARSITISEILISICFKVKRDCGIPLTWPRAVQGSEWCLAVCPLKIPPSPMSERCYPRNHDWTAGSLLSTSSHKLSTLNLILTCS